METLGWYQLRTTARRYARAGVRVALLLRFSCSTARNTPVQFASQGMWRYVPLNSKKYQVKIIQIGWISDEAGRETHERSTCDFHRISAKKPQGIQIINMRIRIKQDPPVCCENATKIKSYAHAKWNRPTHLVDPLSLRVWDFEVTFRFNLSALKALFTGEFVLDKEPFQSRKFSLPGFPRSNPEWRAPICSFVLRTWGWMEEDIRELPNSWTGSWLTFFVTWWSQTTSHQKALFVVFWLLFFCCTAKRHTCCINFGLVTKTHSDSPSSLARQICHQRFLESLSSRLFSDKVKDLNHELSLCSFSADPVPSSNQWMWG